MANQGQTSIDVYKNTGSCLSCGIGNAAQSSGCKSRLERTMVSTNNGVKSCTITNIQTEPVVS